MPNWDFSVISAPYKSQTLTVIAHNRISDLEFSISLQFFSHFEFHFSSHKHQIFFEILDPHAILSKNQPLFVGIEQELEQFVYNLMLMEV